MGCASRVRTLGRVDVVRQPTLGRRPVALSVNSVGTRFGLRTRDREVLTPRPRVGVHTVVIRPVRRVRVQQLERLPQELDGSGHFDLFLFGSLFN